MVCNGTTGGCSCVVSGARSFSFTTPAHSNGSHYECDEEDNCKDSDACHTACILEQNEALRGAAATFS